LSPLFSLSFTFSLDRTGILGLLKKDKDDTAENTDSVVTQSRIKLNPENILVDKLAPSLTLSNGTSLVSDNIGVTKQSAAEGVY
jgi:hypothetical protein